MVQLKGKKLQFLSYRDKMFEIHRGYQMKNRYKKNKYTRRQFALVTTSLGMLTACGSAEDNSQENILTEQNTITGTQNADVIRGTSFNDKIVALSGNDRIFGFEGNDEIYSGMGSDVVYAGSGNDTVNIEDFGTSFDGGVGVDKLVIIGNLSVIPISVDLQRGEVTSNVLQSSSAIIDFENIDASNSNGIEIITDNEDNNITTGNGNDIIQLIGGSDNLNTGAGNDSVTVISGNHNIELGDGDDHLTLTDSSHVADGGNGVDSVIFSTSAISGQIEVDVNLGLISKNNQVISRIDNFESIQINGNLSVTFNGSTEAESFTGTSQPDLFFGGGGNDIYTGGEGTDRFYLYESATSVVQITDFTSGPSGDFLVFQNFTQITSDASSIKNIDTNLAGKKILNDSSDILIFTSAQGYDGSAELLQSVNGQNGVSEQTNGALTGAHLISVWFDTSQNNTKVSILGDANRNGVFDNISNYAILNDFNTINFNSISLDNFLIV